MVETLSQAEISRLNRVITQCDRLINARGRFSASAGLFKHAGQLEVLFQGDGARTTLQVQHCGEVKLRIEWDDPINPGPGQRAVFEPGPWIEQLLAIPAAHA